MCGIIGWWGQAPDPRVGDRVAAGLERMRHRGPDDAGLLTLDLGRLVLGNRRLSIVDLSCAGHQPMSTPDGRYHIVYNGEIYNFGDLRRRVEGRGVKFLSGTDTEVLLHLFAEEGPAMVQRLRGMFAFAIFDAQERRLFLARDRLGIKPLLLLRDAARGIWFASEVKALLAARALRPAIDPTGLIHLSAFGLIPAPRSLFAGVSKLEPGHTLTIEADGTERLDCYWDVFDDLDAEVSRDLAASDAAEGRYLDRLEAELAEAVALRLIADVPVGTLLSGGVDSSLVTALAARSHPGIKSFSIGYQGYRQYDELEWAHRVSTHLGTEHADIWVDAKLVAETLPVLMEAQEEPGSDPQWLSVYFLSTLAKQHGVTVILSGDGGDEVFGGYTKWLSYLRSYRRYWQPLMATPVPIRRVGAAIVGPFLGDVARDMLTRATAGQEFFWGGTQFKDHELHRLIRPEVFEAAKLAPAQTISGYRKRLGDRYGGDGELVGDRYLDWMTYVSLKTSVAENFLNRLDKMGMAASREGRVPLLDHQVIRLALSAPPSLRLKDGQGKYLLKRLLERHLPADIVHRPKMGFQSPMAAWMESGLESEVGRATEVFSELDHFLDPAEARRILSATHQEGRWPTRKWLLVNLALWYGSFLGTGQSSELVVGGSNHVGSGPGT